MARYEVIRPWNGVSLGDVIEIDNPHHALLPNIRKISDAAVLTPATPDAATPKRGRPQKSEKENR